MSDRIGNEISVPPVADALGEVFAAAGHELHLVGGPVRDAILRRDTVDLDFATSAHPEVTQAILEEHSSTIWTTGREFGTIGAMFRGHRVEVTTFRADTYDGVSRNPQVAYGDNLTDDLRRRDFTINAMAVSVPGHEFSDPFGGLTDLAQQTIRTPGTPEDSFADDPLRMMRAARFTSQLGFHVDPAVKTAMTNMARDIERISAERVRDEFVKLMGGTDPVPGLRLLVATGLAEEFLPELPALRMAIDEHAQHKDVYEHTLTVVRNAMSLEEDGPDVLLRIAALLHDIGKPETKGIGPDGRVTFHHHEVAGARIARKRLKALKFPKDDIGAICHLIALHLRFYGYGRGEWTDSAVRRYVTDAGAVLPRLHKLVRSDCTTRNKRKAARLAADYDALEERISRIAAEEDLAKVRPDLNGEEIMTLLEIKPGPQVGKAWKHLKELRLEQGPLSREEAETALFAWAREQGIAVPGSRE
ncbi:CCA tRNA nucleotidyltransferase [Stackebrandtia nassauensis]|uniref:Polynucleotide adenylyltransferase/metal dependent phosphohydrolase n=1 Tax=Stackebrandtia nassauensis (strain DSM 44728 / CIP 108903 / NRRL B-16338 / NBRC 102104 / LLR-40K-21) TaxID=446470 RepID=D3Q5J2_STANL|nr:CCA tRNA nucleotidyltransferase [Stackebrandtia nassauensis]ADD46052.1 polynucleotide adenylyltransferase/metal dependent phosphohydrolase [Stackebrandtia nassauensis DSM 44728]